MKRKGKYNNSSFNDRSNGCGSLVVEEAVVLNPKQYVLSPNTPNEQDGTHSLSRVSGLPNYCRSHTISTTDAHNDSTKQATDFS